jgi:hypothetical protein
MHTFTISEDNTAGLYRQIDDNFRLQYAKLWQALIYGDAVAIKQSAEAMHAGDMYPLFVAMLTHVSPVLGVSPFQFPSSRVQRPCMRATVSRRSRSGHGQE